LARFEDLLPRDERYALVAALKVISGGQGVVQPTSAKFPPTILQSGQPWQYYDWPLAPISTQKIHPSWRPCTSANHG